MHVGVGSSIAQVYCLARATNGLGCKMLQSTMQQHSTAPAIARNSWHLRKDDGAQGTEDGEDLVAGCHWDATDAAAVGSICIKGTHSRLYSKVAALTSIRPSACTESRAHSSSAAVPAACIQQCWQASPLLAGAPDGTHTRPCSRR